MGLGEIENKDGSAKGGRSAPDYGHGGLKAGPKSKVRQLNFRFINDKKNI